MDYRSAGVDIAAADDAKERIKQLLKARGVDAISVIARRNWIAGLAFLGDRIGE